jgi:hypothetical protein
MLQSDGQATGQAPASPTDPFIEKRLEQLKEDITKGFISEYEIAVQYLLEYFKQSQDLDFMNKRKELFKNLLITGQCYYKISTDKKGSLPTFEILHPMDCFMENNPNTPHLNKSSRAVVRRRMSRQEVLLRYGHLIEKDDLEKLKLILQIEKMVTSTL